MPDTIPRDGFSRLRELDFIDDAQLDAIRKLSDPIKIEPDAPLYEHLARLMLRRIVSHRQMIAWDQQFLPRGYSPDLPERLQILRKALAAIEIAAVQLNHHLLDTILEKGLISPSARAAITEVHCPYIFESYGETLAYVVVENGMSRNDLLDLRARVTAMPSSAENSQRIEWVEEAVMTVEGYDKALKKIEPKDITWVVILAVLVMAGFVVHLFLSLT